MLDEAPVSDLGGGAAVVPSLHLTDAPFPQKFDVGYFPFDAGKSARKWLPTKHFLQIRSAGMVLALGQVMKGPEGRDLSQAFIRRQRKSDISRTDQATKPWREVTPNLGDIWNRM